jgi:hypothetical protein
LESEIINILSSDRWIIDQLKLVNSLQLNDCWIGAGFVRNTVWDHLHNFKTKTPLNDVDVIYFDKENIDPLQDIAIEERLREKASNLNWSVKNQARMHLKHDHKPYQNCLEAISFWSETPTAVAAQINDCGEISLIAPYGVHDLLALKVKPTPPISIEVYKARVKEKQWEKRWNKLEILFKG